jgi:hypothetical protein
MKSKNWTPKFIALAIVCLLAGTGLLIIVTGAYAAGIDRIDCPSTVEPGEEFTITGEFSYDSTDHTYWAVELFNAKDMPIGPEDTELASLDIETPSGTGTQSFSLYANAPSSEMEWNLVVMLWVSVWNEDIQGYEWILVDERTCSVDVVAAEVPPVVEGKEITKEAEGTTAFPLWIIIVIIVLIITLLGGWAIGRKIVGKPRAPCEKLRKAVRAAKRNLEAKKMKAGTAKKDLERTKTGRDKTWEKFKASNLTTKNYTDPKTITFSDMEIRDIKKSVDKQIKKEINENISWYGSEYKKTREDKLITEEQREKRFKQLSNIYSKKIDQLLSDGYKEELMKKRHGEILGEKKQVAENTREAAKAYYGAKEKLEKSTSDVEKAKAKLSRLKKKLKECEEKVKKAEDKKRKECEKRRLHKLRARQRLDARLRARRRMNRALLRMKELGFLKVPERSDPKDFTDIVLDHTIGRISESAAFAAKYGIEDLFGGPIPADTLKAVYGLYKLWDSLSRRALKHGDIDIVGMKALRERIEGKFPDMSKREVNKLIKDMRWTMKRMRMRIKIK